MLDAPDAPLYQKLADHIQALITAGTLRSGERVPSVRRLSRQQGVSVATVLQAYQRLEGIGVIEARPQSGFYVRRPAPPVPEPAASTPPRRALTVDVNDLADAVLTAANDPRVVAFGAGCPAPELFSLERVRRVLARCARREREALGRYGLPPGSEALRRAVARRALEWGCRLDPEHIVTTSGCMESLNLALRAVTRPGDLVALESPTYYGFLQILQMLGLRALEIPTHPRTGISLEALEAALAAHPVKAAIVMPNVSNPIGASMSEAAKKRLVQLLEARGVPMIEDHIYADLQFAPGYARAAKAYDRTGNVILCGSFSKTLAPGLKAGWIEAGRWRDAVRRLKWVASGGQNELTEHAVAGLIDAGYDRWLRQLRRRFASQVEAAREAIAESFPRGTRVTHPAGAYILWIELPRGADSVGLFGRLLERGISIAPGPMFSATQRYRNFLRISVGAVWSARHDKALREVGRLAHEA